MKGLLVEGLTEKEVVRPPPACCVVFDICLLLPTRITSIRLYYPAYQPSAKRAVRTQAVFDAFEGDEYIKTEVTIELGSGEAASKQQAWVYVW